MMKTLALLFFSMIIATGSLLAQSNTADKILGTWLNEEKDGKIEIYKSGNKYFGKLVWGKNMYEPDGSSRTDIKNPDTKLRSRKLQDLVILTNFSYDDDEWEGGKIYDPKSGKTYSCVMKFKGASLQIRGYIGISMLGRTTIWTRG
ncbi:DUF2147 domain-containing protein [Chitinophaga pinensis]|uniref:Signal peptide protein n=1 Tax=Chitinophaga pinensis (strain ATCC 43595 / DSM 2588 / LMG 13176 / NBRC 15968 / NCIMB 11800 / UQM 2034) TaxID=485918 RepID=A0A979GAE1_CHIPD|nr:DUF2147 domain-containing protein [Chitinophaga pinensis]ACU63795.1 putative signal peptide protein [Chitinophaga pinensis DSM 2588]